MRINEVEAQVGITKKNIRFYEEQGLLHPRRSTENGYRDYGEGELVTLRQIKLLTKWSAHGIVGKRELSCKFDIYEAGIGFQGVTSFLNIHI